MPPRIGDAELANPSNDAERSEALQRLKSMTLTGEFVIVNDRRIYRSYIKYHLLDFYARPNYGTSGRPIQVYANQ
jgi:hypothetical protein